MWTKSQKISGAVLGLAVVAFGVDRWVLSPLDESSAPADATELVVNRPAPATTSASPAGAPGASVAQVTTLASRLSAVGLERRFDFEPVGDAFRPSDEWIRMNEAALAAEKAAADKSAAAEAPDEAPAAKPAARKKVNYAALFAKRHTLTAVMSNPSGGKAIVDGRYCSPGQTIDGFTLAEVGDGWASFTRKGTRVTLRIKKAVAAGGSATADAR